jgi:hypothetical protein
MTALLALSKRNLRASFSSSITPTKGADGIVETGENTP